MHDERIRAGRKAGESFVARVLIAANHYASITKSDPVGDRRHLAVWHPDSAHFHVAVGPDRRCSAHHGVDRDDVEPHALPRLSQRPPQYRESAATGIEEPPDKRVDGRKCSGASWSGDLQRLLTSQLAQPQQCLEVGDVIRVEVADGQQGQILQPGSGLAKPEERAASGVDHDDGSAVAPDEIACGCTDASRVRSA